MKRDKKTQRTLTKREIIRKVNQRITIFFIIGLLISVALFFFKRDLSMLARGGILIGIVITLFLKSHFQEKLRESSRIKKVEALFPDFLQLMSSNLRAGITVDKSMLLSAREEFDPLDKEIMKTGRDIATGKEIEVALLKMSQRIGSEKISKTTQLIISGIRSGGNMAQLLEETAENMRGRLFLEKRAASNVLMYVIFIFVAVSVGAPSLFGLSNILVEVLTNLLGNLPDVSAVNTPFTLSRINLSINFVFYFSLVFIVVIDLLASMVLGLVSKGEEKEGMKYFIPLVLISLPIFLIIKFSLAEVVIGMLG